MWTTLEVLFAFRTEDRIAVLPTLPVSCTAHDNFCIGFQPKTIALPVCRPVRHERVYILRQYGPDHI